MQNTQQLLFANDEGEGGIPVVFLHSLAGNIYQWSKQIDHLKSKRRTIGIDWRGHGNSPAVNGDFNLHHLADDLKTTFDQLGLNKFILIAHSAGASLALAYVEKYPHKAAGLLLADPSGDARMIPNEQSTEFISLLESDKYKNVIEKYWIDTLKNSTEATKAQVMNDLRSTNKNTVIGVFKALLEFDPLLALKTYKCPVLAVITPLNKQPYSLQNIYPKLNYVEIEDTSHWLQLDKPEEFNKIMDDFLDRIQE